MKPSIGIKSQRHSALAVKTLSQKCARRLLDGPYGAGHDNDRLRHFIYYIDQHIELDGDSHGPMGRELLANLVANSPQAQERAVQAACRSIKARIELWNGLLSKLRSSRGGSIERELPDDQWTRAGKVGQA